MTLIADGVSFGRVASVRPVSLLSARTSRVNVAADNLAMTGRCIDTTPMRLTERDGASAHLARTVVWTDGTLSDDDGVSTRLRFRTQANPPYQHDITDILDAVPWHKKQISLDNVVVEFSRAADCLWLRAELKGFVLRQRAGRFFVASANDARTPARLKWVFPPQSFSEQAFLEEPPQATPSGPKLKQSDPIPETELSALRVAHESILVFAPKASRIDEFELTVKALLDPQKWAIHVAPEASSDEKCWRDAVARSNQQGTDEYTRLELPWRVEISPNQHAALETSPLKLAHNRHMHPLFCLRPCAADAKGDKRLPLRAIASDDFFEGTWLHYGAQPDPSYRPYIDPVRTNLDEQDRNELVWLSGTWGRYGLLGSANVRKLEPKDRPPVACKRPDAKPDDVHDANCKDLGIYVPQPFYADRLLLTSLGASLCSTGKWDPPSLHIEHGSDGKVLAMSMEEWTHVSTLARPHFDRVVDRGFMLPYGFRVAIVKMTVREIRFVTHRGLMAVPIQRFFLRVEEGEKVFPAAVGQPLESRNGFFQPERLTLDLDHDVQIDDPSDQKYTLAGLGQDAFWVRAPSASPVVCPVENNPNGDSPTVCFPFPIKIGADGRGTAPLAFVSNDVVHNAAQLDLVVGEFNRHGGSPLDAHGARITYAPSVRTGDTRFVTHLATVKVIVNESLVNSAVLEEQHLPPFFPVLDTAHVELDAIQRATAGSDRQLTEVAYTKLYKSVGFATTPVSDPILRSQQNSQTISNPAEVFLNLISPVTLSYTNNGERSGGVATPNMQPNALSRTQGLMSGFADIHDPGTPGVTARLSRIVQRRANESMRKQHPLARQRVAQSTTQQSASAAGGFGNPFASDAKLLGIVPLSVFFDAAGLGDLPRFVESIEEGISESLEQLKRAAQEFGQQIKVAIAQVRKTLSASDDFRDTEAGQRILNDVDAIDAAAQRLQTSDATKIPDEVAAVSGQIRNLRDDFQTIANNPEALFSVNEIKQLATMAASISTILTSNLAQVRQKLSEDRNAVVDKLNDFVEQAQSDASENLRVLSEQFIERVVTELAAHRSDLANIEAALATGIEVPDAVLRLAKLVELYRRLYIDGFGLQDALDQIVQSVVHPLMDDIATLRADTRALRTSLARDLARLYDKVFDLGFALDSAWHVVQQNQPALAKQLAPAFADLANLLNSYAAASAGAASPPGDPLELVNRAHRLLARIDAAVEAAGNQLEASAQMAIERAEKALSSVCDTVANGLVTVSRDLTRIQDDLNKLSVLQGPRLALESFVKSTTQTIDTASNGTGAERALALCEAIGNLLDQRLAAAPPDARKSQDATLISLPQDILVDMSKLAIVAWGALRQILAPLSGLCLEQNETVTHILGKDFIDDTNQVGASACALVNSFDAEARQIAVGTVSHSKPSSGNCTSQCDCKELAKKVVNLLDLAQQLEDADSLFGNWFAALRNIRSNLEARALEEIKGVLDSVVERMIPARTHLDFVLPKKTLSDYAGVFIAHGTGPETEENKAHLELEAHIEADLIARTQSSRFSGRLTSFQINLLDVICIEVLEVRFEANDGHFHLDQPRIGDVTMGGDLDFVKAFESLMGGTSGPYIEPVPNGIRAGYRLAFPLTPVGPFIVQNFSFEVGILIPFDDRAALINVAMATESAPCLISFGIYGGGAFFSMLVAGTKLVSIEAAFEYGLVGGFSFPAVQGTGRVVVGLYFGLEGGATRLRGYFYAGGHATVLGFVSISADLRLSITYETGKGAHGEGQFHVEIGAGPFSWTLTYTVEHSAQNALFLTGATQMRLADARSGGPPQSSESILSNQHLCGTDLLNDDNWFAYRAAFALDDLPRKGAA
ncbi:apolipoprotein A1/A4/E family protein [Caballeronia sp. GACF4]|uniref:apolipoprotein A1/A4/E family protein n=1 Tax=Caballeronia sp. GACF4 TaxID=2921763 RepID=UPI00202822CF|nr:apolipoprotein A1/A4/E family protein [Caballeronia sp. GACF4]